MAVLGDDAAFFQEHAGQHNFLADDELALQERVEVFERDGVPGNVLEHDGRAARREVSQTGADLVEANWTCSPTSAGFLF